MDPNEAAADFLRRLLDISKRYGCHLMVAWSIVRRRGFTCPAAVRRRIPIPSPRRARAIASRNPHECVVCGDPVIPQDETNVTFVPCGHEVHAECGKRMVASYVEQGKDMPFACPFAPCRGVIAACPTPFRASFLPRAYAPCPGKECSRFVLSFAEGAHEVACKACETRFCHSCRCAPHAKETPCMAVVKSVARKERLDSAMSALDAVNLKQLGRQMFLQHVARGAAAKVQLWQFIENQVRLTGLPSSGTQPLPLPHLAEIAPAELIRLARAALNPADTRLFMEDARATTVLEDAMAAIGFAPMSSGDASEVEVHSKFCPRCFVRIVRTDGCPSMRCRCGHYFCYDCLGPQHTHGKCDQKVNVAALKAAAVAAGERPGVVDDLAYFSDESEVFAKLVRLVGEDKIVNGVDLGDRRTVRLVPFIIAIERYSALTEAGLEAPMERARLVDALRDEHALVAHFEAMLRLSIERGVAAIAGRGIVVEYAAKRVAAAKMRVRGMLADPDEGRGAAVAAELAGLRAIVAGLEVNDWLYSNASTSISRGDAITLEGITFWVEYSNEWENVITLYDERRHRNTRTCVPRCVVNRASLDAYFARRVGTFLPSEVDSAHRALKALATNVMDAAIEAAAACTPPPAFVTSDIAPLRLREGDLVVRGPRWKPTSSEGRDDVGAVQGFARGGELVEVYWLRGGQCGSYNAHTQQVVRPRDFGHMWSKVSAFLHAHAPDKRKVACLDAVLSVPAHAPDKRKVAWLDAVLSVPASAPAPAPASAPNSTKFVDASFIRALAAVRRTPAAAAPSSSSSVGRCATCVSLRTCSAMWRCGTCEHLNSCTALRCDACDVVHHVTSLPASALDGNFALHKLSGYLSRA